MNIVTVINAKGGCGKSTIAMSLAAGLGRRGYSTLLIDMDPQAQVTQWLNAGDGLRAEGTLAAALEGRESFEEIIQSTPHDRLSFVASSEGLEELGRQITDIDGYATLLTRLLAGAAERFHFVIIDSPNQISPIMENAIYPSDLFIVPFESTKAVRSYANFYKLLMRLRPGEEHRLLHVLSNLSRQPGLRQRVIEAMHFHGVPRARTEIRTCGWLAQVDEHGGSIFHYRPLSKGAADMALLIDEVLEQLGVKAASPAPATVPEQAPIQPTEPAPEATKATVSTSAEPVAVPPEISAETLTAPTLIETITPEAAGIINPSNESHPS